ncbi:hypothetical protein C5Y96_08025 [Blastopirellula marina]|uniref:Uncharacterized protein n=1 Tax=Blastopirellula marina TaxID=124 RepID=A0A2S8FY36_9BACT|nr:MULTISPECIES: hypothetical protein [Pirellulaceae]PQO37096.1 hypothetical protein C5Y96_08025 [Blastopirellula marina]RCS53811.1 hypothetical protein DTL36_08035 [Bremerella cremea]
MTPNQNLLTITLVLLAFYVGSYAVLSRQGIEQAALQDSEVYYFVEPTSEGRVSSHMVCCLLYMPLIVIETRLGSQYYPDLCCHHSLS